MKKFRFAIIPLLVAALMLTGCEFGFGSKYVVDPEEYGKWESYLEVPSFLPESIESYQVNAYSYTLLAYMDICYEIFLDLTVSEEQLEELISRAKAEGKDALERAAYYADGYYEIVLQDYYEVYHRESDHEALVGWADIEKVVYNPQTRNLVYVCFHANDTGVYNLDEVNYFNRFSIDEEEYALNIQK